MNERALFVCLVIAGGEDLPIPLHDRLRGFWQKELPVVPADDLRDRSAHCLGARVIDEQVFAGEIFYIDDFRRALADGL